MRILKLVVWNILLFLVLVELAAVAAYFVKSGSLYYADRPHGKSIPLHTATVEGYRLHPYLGFVLHPGDGGGSGVNNMGFAAPWDYPTERRPGELLVGVFGGSVASYVATFEQQHGLIAARLAAATGREPSQIRVLNFAQGGYKQPQQVQILAYLLAIGQPLDAVINIDGFNEVALAQRNRTNGLAAHMPSIEHIRPLQEVTAIGGRSEGLEIMREARVAYAEFARVYNRAWSGKAWETRFAAGFLAQFVRYRMLERRFRSLTGALIDERRDDGASLSWLYLEAPAAASRGDLPLTDWGPVVDVWSLGARTVARLARSHALVHVHAIQPNQYVPTERIFGDDERALAMNDASAYGELVPEGYPPLLQEALRLEDEGFPILDLTRVFDDVDEIVYVDDCCHYNDAGNRVVVGALADALADAFVAEGLRSPTSAAAPRR